MMASHLSSMRSVRKTFTPNRTFTLFLIFLLAPWTSVQAETLFVDVLDATCEDTSGDPYCSIGAAVEDAVAGDVIVIRSGTYQERLTISKDLTLKGISAVTTVIDGQGLGTVLTLSGSVVVEDLAITGGLQTTGSLPGGILTSGNTQLIDCILSENRGTGGGAIRQESGTLTLERTTVRFNTSSSGASIGGGGGIWNAGGTFTIEDSEICDNQSTHPVAESGGGGLRVSGLGGTVTRSTICRNSSQNDAGGVYLSAGSLTLTDSSLLDNTAVLSSGAVRASSPLALINSTVSGNLAEQTVGAIFVSSLGGELTLRNATIFDNSATKHGGINVFGPSLVSNSIISGNRGTDGFSDCPGTLVSEGYNLLDPDCTVTGDATGNIIDADPGLLPRSGFSHIPAKDSPALDAGSPALPGLTPAACPATDQNGLPRPKDSDGNGTAGCSIGAVETAEIFFGDFESGGLLNWTTSVF